MGKCHSSADIAMNTGKPSRRVFDRFFRGDPAHSQTVDGCGLGLSIAQWIVTTHNRTVKIESATAKPTTVAVRLPLDTK